MIKLIAAVSLNNVIGDSQTNNIPWMGLYPEDMKFFRTATANSTVIMGRNTFTSIGKALPKRRNIVLTSRITPKLADPNVEAFTSLENALRTCEGQQIWIIGGSTVYKEAMAVADELYITNIPQTINGDNLVYFPTINTKSFELKEKTELNKDKNLYVSIYRKLPL